jgi:hypothetical protein
MYGNDPYNPNNSVVPAVPFTQPTNIFRFGEQAIWSTQLLSNNAVLDNSTERLFSTAIGGTGGGFTNPLSIAETNIKEGGRVPSGAAYDVFGIAAQVLVSDNTADTGDFDTPVDSQALVGDLLRVIQNGVLAWDFLQTKVDICPVLMAGAGGGAFGSVSTGNAADVGHMNNGNGNIWMYRKHPVSLAGSSTFNVLLQFGSRAGAIGASNSVAVRVALLGYYKNIIEIG